MTGSGGFEPGHLAETLRQAAEGVEIARGLDPPVIDLIDAIAATGIDWIRIYYVHPGSLTIDLLRRIFEHPAVCRYLESPFQHASDRILRQIELTQDAQGNQGCQSLAVGRYFVQANVPVFD